MSQVDLKASELVSGLRRIERWVRDVCEVLESGDPDRVIARVESPVEGAFLKQGQCPPPLDDEPDPPEEPVGDPARPPRRDAG